MAGVLLITEDEVLLCYIVRLLLYLNNVKCVD